MTESVWWIYIPASSPLNWDSSKVRSTRSQGSWTEHPPVTESHDQSDNYWPLSFVVLLPHSTASVSWGHLSNKLLAHQSLSCGLILSEPKLKQLSEIDHRIKYKTVLPHFTICFDCDLSQ